MDLDFECWTNYKELISHYRKREFISLTNMIKINQVPCYHLAQKELSMYFCQTGMSKFLHSVFIKVK